MAEWTGPDWRDCAVYSPLLGADRSMFAWEWLRRDRHYRLECSTAPSGAGPEQFGLVRFEEPGLTIPHARPLWRFDVHPYVLQAEPVHTGLRGESFDPEAFREMASTVVSGPSEHLLLSDGWRTIRLDGPEGAFSGGRVTLRYSLAGLASAEPPLLTLRRFLALVRSGGFLRSLHRPEVRARRWVAMLRAFDALEAGADQRLIASEIFRGSVTEPGWRSRDSSVRSQVQRLVRASRVMASGGHLRFLGAK